VRQAQYPMYSTYRPEMFERRSRSDIDSDIDSVFSQTGGRLASTVLPKAGDVRGNQSRGGRYRSRVDGRTDGRATRGKEQYFP
jgi:hypothetical protein